MKTKPFSELRKQMTPERRAKNKTRAKLMSLHLTLLELQESLGLKPEEIEAEFNNFEATIAELENQEDIQISTLSRYIKALGGNLKIVAHFPNEEITLAQFE
ncbi:XRE family transcriptional regulator [Sphaerospermopsis torques-reginae]|uniref:XRE family transcriptional regulator n=1 Tax=Sphaerospermopsis torques-reginae ITEP-024 TaxID=984208 RepID=A0ABX8X5L5_9CYAN|nr:XRE family transcriptional regulator [Sphaerospermopsis torques-reginae]QYX33998.1 XRE family transcriptional regulator [Sphaerospermopsis torques-reginae ITEP-024]